MPRTCMGGIKLRPVLACCITVTCAIFSCTDAMPVDPVHALVTGDATQMLLPDDDAQILADMITGHYNSTYSTAILRRKRENMHTLSSSPLDASAKYTPALQKLVSKCKQGDRLNYTPSQWLQSNGFATHVHNTSVVRLRAAAPVASHSVDTMQLLADKVVTLLEKNDVVQVQPSSASAVEVAAAAESENIENIVHKLASMDAIAAIEPLLLAVTKNSVESKIVQSGKVHTDSSSKQDVLPLWDKGFNGSGEVVHIGDNVVDTSHCLFSCNGKVQQYYNEPNNPSNGAFHGTHTAATIAGYDCLSESESESGVAKNASLVITGLGENLEAYHGFDTVQEAYLLPPIDDHNASVSSSSFGFAGEPDRYNLMEHAWDKTAFDRNSTVYVVAAGNDGSGAPRTSLTPFESFEAVTSPASAKNVIAVGASASANTTTTINDVQELEVLELVLDDGSLSQPIPVQLFPPATVSRLDLAELQHLQIKQAKRCSDFDSEKAIYILPTDRDMLSIVRSCGDDLPGGSIGPTVYVTPGVDCAPTESLPLNVNSRVSSYHLFLSMSRRNVEMIATLMRYGTSMHGMLQERGYKGVQEPWDAFMLLFSAAGPSPDGRVKPDVVAPGLAVSSAAAWTPCGLKNLSGTSMATPLVSGSAAIVRQFLRESQGFTSPSGASIKAVLINGAQNMRGYVYTRPPQEKCKEDDAACGDFVFLHEYGEQRSYYLMENGTLLDTLFKPLILDQAPGCNQGFGRVQLSSSLPIENQSGSPASLEVFDDHAVAQDEVWSVNVTIQTGKEVRTTLVWYDRAPSVVVEPLLVNDLDLQVDGLNASGHMQWSRPVIPDAVNTVERVILPKPDVATLQLKVSGKRISKSTSMMKQPFALVVTGNIAAVGNVHVDSPSSTNFHGKESSESRKQSSDNKSKSSGLSNGLVATVVIVSTALLSFLIALAVYAYNHLQFFRHDRLNNVDTTDA